MGLKLAVNSCRKWTRTSRPNRPSEMGERKDTEKLTESSAREANSFTAGGQEGYCDQVYS